MVCQSNWPRVASHPLLKIHHPPMLVEWQGPRHALADPPLQGADVEEGAVARFQDEEGDFAAERPHPH